MYTISSSSLLIWLTDLVKWKKFQLSLKEYKEQPPPSSFAPINLQAVGESHIKLKLVANKHIKIMLQNHEFYSSIYAYSKVPNDSLHAKCNFLRSFQYVVEHK
uniref:Uncharacterized protein n=1 Tax=Glossina palpalis gambiensis TaxID=67801 RepID=A0A1B0B7L9_9MUSC